MKYTQLNIDQYNSFLSEAYSLIYRHDDNAWGISPNSDLQALVPTPSGRILDFGCGYGKNIGHLLCGEAEVWGVDLCSDGIELAKSQYEVHLKKGRLTLVHGDERSDLPVFDLIICSGVLVDHLRERRLVIVDRLKDLLSPGGLLFLTVFGKNDPAHGRGQKVEKNTYVHEFGFPVHYFLKEEIIGLFNDMHILCDYTRLKPDFYPNYHVHETHILLCQNTSSNKCIHQTG